MNDAFILGGLGYVGKATAKSLNIPYYFTRHESNISLEEGAKKQFCFICLPTPTDREGQQTEARKVIHDYIAQIKEYGGRNIFVIRSTVLPGTCRALSEELGVMVASSPEFLSEKTWEEDAIKPRMLVIGADSQAVKIALVEAWKNVKCKLRIETDTVTSEMIKYTFNTFGVTKVVFANQIYDICQKNGADYEMIHYALHKHPWGSKEHFKVEHKGGRGGGGTCFPKDVLAFAKYSNSPLLQKVEELNLDYLAKSGKK